MQIPQADVFQLGFNSLWDEVGIAHLGKGGNNDIFFTHSLQRPFQAIGGDR